jgi:hypothetical protein
VNVENRNKERRQKVDQIVEEILDPQNKVDIQDVINRIDELFGDITIATIKIIQKRLTEKLNLDKKD